MTADKNRQRADGLLNVRTADEEAVLLAVEDALADAGIHATEEQRRLLARHLSLVIDKNRQLNLTRVDDARSGAYLHVVDSLLLLDAFAPAPKGAFVDVGTGAGYPGIPLAIMTGRPATLVDSVQKKVKAVKGFVEALGLSRVEAVSERIETLGRERRGRYAVVTARAVAQTNVLVEYAAPLLHKGGLLVVAKGRPTTGEVEAGNRAARLCGMRNVSRETYELPHDMGHREVLVYERVGNPSVKLPRAVGMAKKLPLGM